MPFAIFSYREGKELYCGSGCHCYKGSIKSNLDVKHFEKSEDVITYLISRYKEEPHARYKNFIFDRFDHLCLLDEFNRFSPTNFKDSLIFVENDDISEDPFGETLVKDSGLILGKVREGIKQNRG